MIRSVEHPTPSLDLTHSQQLLGLLIKLVDIEMNLLTESLNQNKKQNTSLETHASPLYHRSCVGYILKILVNINGVDDSHHNALIQNIQLGQKLRILATLDEFIAFYANILGIV
jgi:hypothetical protein